MTRRGETGVVYVNDDGTEFEAWGFTAAGAAALVAHCDKRWSPRPVRVIHRDTETREANE